MGVRGWDIGSPSQPRSVIPPIKSLRYCCVIPSHQPHHGVVELNGEGAVSDYESNRAYLRGDFVTGWESFDVSPINFQPRFVLPVGPQIGIDLAAFNAFQGDVVSEVGVLGRSEVIREGASPVFAPRGRETDWDYAYDRFVEDNPELDLPPREETVYSRASEMVVDPDVATTETVFETSSGPTGPDVAFWDTIGDIFTTSAPEYASGWIQSQFQPTAVVQSFPPPLTTPGFPSGPGAAPYAAQQLKQQVMPVQDQQLCAVPAAQPRYLRYNCQTGQFSKVPRRRRRRLLTSSDLKDLAALKAIVGGGAKMDGAIVQAIRR